LLQQRRSELEYKTIVGNTPIKKVGKKQFLDKDHVQKIVSSFEAETHKVISKLRMQQYKSEWPEKMTIEEVANR